MNAKTGSGVQQSEGELGILFLYFSFPGLHDASTTIHTCNTHFLGDWGIYTYGWRLSIYVLILVCI